ncbi:glutathione S-transferase [uncultured Cohaesibacter sp.]|uniref:glutathione S-transferase n=1 Tax=uncultured Cohaesibacter sp. TaxID=1002546 RepID=UPI0029C77699|nr:glutathione S-transferase [uncultured Cohaesibacter sp.]
MSNSNTLPILYSFRRCPYAMRARMGLFASGTIVEIREIVLRGKPAHMLEISPKGTVPVLLLPDGTVIDESLEIMLWALKQNDPHEWLTPESGSIQDALALIEELDGSFKHHLDRYKYSSRFENADEVVHRAMAMVALAPLQARLELSPHLFGGRPCLADIAIFPFVRQFANTDRDWFDSNAPVALRKWLVGHESSDLFVNIFSKWPTWQEGDPVTLFPAIPHAEMEHMETRRIANG